MKFPTKSVKTAIAFFIVITLILTTASCTKEYPEKTSFAMGSVLTAKIICDDEAVSDEIFSAITTAVNKSDLALSATKENSELSQLNATGKIYATEYFKEVLSRSIFLCNILNGTVNITVGNLTSLWGFSTDSPSLPSDEDIQSALSSVNISNILIDNDTTKILLEQGTTIDLGAFGKGAACDAAYDAIKNSNIPLIVSLGGTVMAYGEGQSDGKWNIGVRDPFGDANTVFATLSLSPNETKNAIFVSTSGNYEKTFTENGKTYHHILDPETGYPVDTDIVSVTVVSHSGLHSDALSTGCFINGLNDDMLQTLTYFSAEAIFVFADKTYYVTDGLKDSFTLNDTSFILREYEK